MNILGKRKKKLADHSSNPARTTLLGAMATGSLQNSQWPPLMTNSKSSFSLVWDVTLRAGKSKRPVFFIVLYHKQIPRTKQEMENMSNWLTILIQCSFYRADRPAGWLYSWHYIVLKIIYQVGFALYSRPNTTLWIVYSFVMSQHSA